MALSDKKLVAISIGAFIICFYILAIHILWGDRLSSGFPYGLMANDAFDHFTDAEFLKDHGKYDYLPDYMSGGFTGAVTYDQPLLYHLTVIFMETSSLPSYTSMYFIVVTSFMLSAILFFLVIRKKNVHLALLSLPFSLLVFFSIFPSMFTWGQWLYIMGALFLMLFFWAISNLGEKAGYLILSLSLVAMMMAHFSEFVFGAIFMVFYLGIGLTRKMLKRDLQYLILGAFIALGLSFYFLVRFMNTMFKMAGSLKIVMKSGSKTTMTISMLPWWLILLFIVGLFLSIYLLITRKYHISFAIGGFMLLMGYSNFIGFSERAFQLRYSWPIYLSIFFAMALYQLLKLIFKENYRIYHTILTYFAILVALAFFVYSSPVGDGLMTKERYNAFTWINSHTDPDARILLLYFDGYDQKRIWNIMKRRVWGVQPEDYYAALQSRIIKRTYVVRENISPIFLEKTFFGYEFIDPQKEALKEQDICSFDYYYVEKSSGYIQILGDYNQMVSQNLMKSGSFVEVYSNKDISILKNTKAAKECIPKEGVKL